jgi:hypothetical protein
MFTRMHLSGRIVGVCLFAFGFVLTDISPPAVAAPANVTTSVAQESFGSAEDAVAALTKALQANDAKELRAILGPNSDKLVASGDPVDDTNARTRFLEDYAASHKLTSRGDGQQVLVVGPDEWPLPIPIVRTGDVWRFDATEGAQEIVDRRIGENELLTIRTLLAAVEAEKDYFDRVKSGAGAGVYAQRMFSTADGQDGLYWEVAPGEVPSPLGPLIDQAKSEGYPGALSPAGVPVPYRGYLYRILKAQGANAPGGAKTYIRDGQMTEGFAMVAWPVTFENSGIMTFLVNQDGVVFQKDLGPNSAKLVAGIASFNPDLTWTRIDVSD